MTTLSRPPLRAVGVLVPARDEAVLLPACLDAIFRSLAHPALADLDRAVVVAADRCRDSTAEVARQAGAAVVEGSFGGPGGARRAAVDPLLAMLGSRATWLATTDADSVVPPDWLARQVKLADEGVDAVAGSIRVACWDEHPERVRTRYEAMLRFRRRPDGQHTHVYGANLGFRAEALLAVGGMPHLAVGEDLALWRAFGRAGLSRHSPADLVVGTSGRARGRAKGGLADLLGRITG